MIRLVRSAAVVGCVLVASAHARADEMAEHADEVASYTLAAKLDPAAHGLEGTGSIRWRNASSRPVSELYVHLYLNAFKNQKTVFMREPAAGFRGAGAPKDYGWIQVERFFVREMDADVWPSGATTPNDPADETDIAVPLPRPVAPGDTITIDVGWKEHLPAVLLRTGYDGSFHMVGQWFPKIARLEDDGTWRHFPFHHLSEFYADFGSYDVTIDVPAGVVVGATGELQGETKEGDRVKHRYVQSDVHDFAFTAWSKFHEATREAEGVKVRCLFPPGYDRAAQAELDAVAFGLHHFGTAYGAYPYRTLTVVHPPAGAEEAGGMEYPTLITTGGPWFMPWTPVRFLEVVTLHELGHQWFYGLVATDENRWPFLDEGINSYAEADVMETLVPDATIKVLGLGISEPAFFRIPGNAAADHAPVWQPAPAFVSGSDYGALVYQRTATILLTLAGVYGRERVRDAIGHYARDNRFRHPTAEAFVESMRASLGDEAGDQLRMALGERATVDYSIERIRSEAVEKSKGIFGDPLHPGPAPDATAESGWTGDVLVRRSGRLRFPVDIELTGEDGHTARFPWSAQAQTDDERTLRIPYEGQTKLAAAVVDPDHHILLDASFANDAKAASPSRVSPSVFESILFAAQLALSLGPP